MKEKNKIDIPPVPAVAPLKEGFQPPEVPKIEAVPDKPENSTYSGHLYNYIAGAPDPELEAKKEAVLKRKAQIINLTGAMKALASSVYSDKGYITPRPQPNYLLAKTQSELQRQKNAYAADLAAYQARKTSLYGHAMTLQQQKEIEDARLKDKAIAEGNLHEYRTGSLEAKNRQLDIEGNKQKETVSHNTAMEDIAREKTIKKTLEADKKSNFIFTSNKREYTIPNNELYNVYSKIATKYRATGKTLPFYKTVYDVAGDPLKTIYEAPDMKQIKDFIINNYHLIEASPWVPTPETGQPVKKIGNWY